jgi:hypothetical protein
MFNGKSKLINDETDKASISNLNITENKTGNHSPGDSNFDQRITVATNELKKQYVQVINANS